MSESSEADLIDLVAGRLLGEGAYRRVFECKLDKTRVLKHANLGKQAHNIIEYKIWDDVLQYDKILKNWFAPCYAISDQGLWLVQARTTPLSVRDLPKRIPKIMTDTKPANWGWYKGRPVCHDYGNSLFRLNLIPKKFKKANWFGTEGY